jgi:putative ABC transport system permease protein
MSLLGLKGGLRAEVKQIRLPPTGSAFRVTALVKNGSSRLFTPHDLEAIRGRLQHQQVRLALESENHNSPLVLETRENRSRIVHEQLTFRGVSRDYFLVRGYRLANGRIFTTDEERRAAKVAVVGAGLARRWGLTVGSVLSDPPYVRDQYLVIGILFPVQESIRSVKDLAVPEGPDHTAFVPCASLPVITSPYQIVQPPQTFALVGSVPEGQLQGWLDRLPRLLSEWYPGVSFSVEPVESLGPILRRVEEKVGTYFAWAVAIVLLIGVLSVTNVVLMMVLRRARVIGIKHALGATVGSLVLEYLCEAVLLTGAGALLGLTAGWLGVPLLARLLDQEIVVGWRQAGYCVLAEFVCGVLAGLYPALVAAKLPPVEAIRGGALAAEPGKGRLRLRDVLAGLAVCAGLGALVFTVALGDLTSAGVEMYLRGAGRDLVFVAEPDPFFREAEKDLDRGTMDHLLHALQEQLGWRPPTAWEESFITEVAGAFTAPGLVVGVSPGYTEVRAWRVARGRDLEPRDFTAGGRAALIGSKLARALFPEGDPIGRSIRVGDGPAFRIEGVLQEKPQEVRDFGVDRDWCLIIPAESLSDVPAFHVAQVTRRVVMVPPPGGSPEELRKAVERILDAAHEGAFEVSTPAAQLRGLLGFQAQVTRGMALGSFVALLAAGLGIASVTLMRVVERTREIAVRRAIGASRPDILGQFVAGAVRLALAGAAAGLAAGAVAAEVMASRRGLPVGLSATWFLIAVGVAIGLGALFGTYPACAATKVDPVEILREE